MYPHILVCAPSNIAIEQLLYKIHENGLINNYGMATWALYIVKVSWKIQKEKDKLNYSSTGIEASLWIRRPRLRKIWKRF
ncbi:unnamed protein product [Blepharisma stoltei]|uniref:Uncharacterized protein n=1 Tax=Blepharisma stoltei TaxID=1481888 RepID=A0AAU9KKF9_9CILI|nr:unnamed protein product [Blepharisma stoltei]